MWTDKHVTDKNLRITRSTELYLEVTSTSWKSNTLECPSKHEADSPLEISRKERREESGGAKASNAKNRQRRNNEPRVRKGGKSHDRVRKRESTAIGGKWTRSFVRFPLSRCSAARIPALSSRHPPRSAVEGHGEETTASAFFRDTRITRRLVCGDAH